MNHGLLTHLTCALALTSFALPASGTLILHDPVLTGADPFAGQYDPGVDLLNQNPTVTGFTGAWSKASTTNGSVSASGLAYPGLTSSGGSFLLESNNTRMFRSLDTGAVLNSSVSGTYYISFLFQGSAPDSQYRGLEFFNGSTDSGVRNLRIGMGGGANGFGDGTFFGARVSSSTTVNLGSSNTGTNLFVVRLDLNATAAADSFSVYVNPTDMGVEGNNTVSGTSASLDIAFDRVALALFTTGSVRFDELRMGTTWQDVTTVPEPSVYALAIGLVGGALIYLRRRQHDNS